MAYCPNCASEIAASVAQCPSCPALFGEGSAWAPLDHPPSPHVADGGIYFLLVLAGLVNSFALFGVLYVIGLWPIGLALALALMVAPLAMASRDHVFEAGLPSFGLVPVLLLVSALLK